MKTNQTELRGSRFVPRLRLCAQAAILAACPFLGAQTTAPATSPAESSEEPAVVQLNPFVVEAEKEVGWVATESLAGSRLRTELRDIAAPIEVLTMEFMKDFGLTSYAEATIYTTNVEGFGDNLETGPGLGLGTGFPPPVRVRGLGNASLSRDFFAVQMPMDNYNVDRVTIAAGANNLLFGLGNPAGVIDANLKRPVFRDITRFDMQFDSHETQRYSFDFNRQLVKDKLAVRVAAVKENKEFEYKPSHYDHERLYGAVTYAPWKSTSISVHFEDVDVDNMRPSLLLPFDAISPWYTAGSIPGWSYNGVSADRPVYNNLPINLTAPALGFGNVAALNNTVFERSGAFAALLVGPNAGGLQNRVINLRNTVRVKPAQMVPTVNGLSREADGFTLLDNTYFSDRVNLGGLSRKEQIGSKIANIFITQQVGKHLSFELAAQKEDYLSRNAGMFSYVDGFTLNVDPNRFAPDGVTPNPNLGKLYVEGTPYQMKTKYDSEDWRFTTSYEYDFGNKGESWWRQLLGRQRLAGLISGNSEEQRQAEYYPRILPVGGLTGRNPVFSGAQFSSPLNAQGQQITNWTTNGSRPIKLRYYIDGDVPSPSQDLFAPLQFTDDTGEVFTLDMENTGLTDSFGRRLGAGRISGFDRWIKTQQLAYQGFFWDNRLAVTLGWRRDTTNSGDLADGANIAHVSGLFPVLEDLRFSYNPTNEQTGSTRTRGFVLRPLRGLVKLPFDADISLTWNRSNTFQPNASTVDPFGNRYPGAHGASENKGIRLEMWKGRFAFRYVDFEDTAGPARAANVPFNRFRFGIAAPINRVKQLAGLTAPLTPYNNNLGFNAGGDGLPYSVMSFQRATGQEFGLDWNVSKNLQIKFNMNRQEVVESNIAKDWFLWMELEQPKYAALTYPEGGVSNPRDMNGDGVIGTWNWNTAWFTDSSPRTIADEWTTGVIGQGQRLIESLDGKSNEFVRDDRFNIMASWRFTEGRLQGLSIGGAFRYRAAPLIGYGSEIFEGQQRIDIDTPYYGKTEKIVDLSINYKYRRDFWRFSNMNIGLNVRNLLNDDDNFIRLRGVDGQPTRMARVSEGRTYILSMGFEL